MIELLTDEKALEMAAQILNTGPGGLLDVGIAANLLRAQQIGYKLGQIEEVEINSKKNCHGCRDNIPFENVEYRFAHRISKYGVSICESSREQSRLRELREELEKL